MQDYAHPHFTRRNALPLHDGWIRVADQCMCVNQSHQSNRSNRSNRSIILDRTMTIKPSILSDDLFLSTPMPIETDRFRSSYRVERGPSCPDSHHPTSISVESADAPGLRASALPPGEARLKRRGAGVVIAGKETGLLLRTAVARAQEASVWVEDDLFARAPRYIVMVLYILLRIALRVPA